MFNVRETDFEAAYSALRRDIKAALGNMPEKISDFELAQAVASQRTEIARLRSGLADASSVIEAILY